MMETMDANDLHKTMDAQVWARTFMEYSKRYGPFDEDTMLGWFANAIMCGWDHHAQSSDTDAKSNEKELESVKNFETELTGLINHYSIENASNTPDFILAQFISGCLESFNGAVQQREKWYGRQADDADRATQGRS